MKIVGAMLILMTALSQQSPLSHRHKTTNEIEAPTADTCSPKVEIRTGTVATLLSQASNPGTDANSRLAISIWYDLNVMCRGGNHSPEVDQACCLRNKIDSMLNNMGYCYHMGEIWKKCGPRDKRARRASLAACAQ